MILTVLDKEFKAVVNIDSYSSLVWTERYCDASEFELTISPTFLLDYKIKKGYYIVSNDSEKMMIIETLEIDTGDDEGDVLIIKGRSLESVLDRRVVYRLTRFGVSDSEEAHYPTAPPGYQHIDWIASAPTGDNWYDTGLAYEETDIRINGSFGYKGSMPRNKGIFIFGWGNAAKTNGAYFFQQYRHQKISAVIGNLSNNLLSVDGTLSDPSQVPDGIPISVLIANDNAVTFTVNGSTVSLTSYSGTAKVSDHLYFFNTNPVDTWGSEIKGNNVVICGPVEVNNGAHHYMYYPVQNEEDGTAILARYKLNSDNNWEYDEDDDFSGNHGTFVAGPRSKYISVRLYKAATALVDENFINNAASDPYWGDMTKRNIPYLTCAGDSEYTDPLVVNWNITGSYYGQVVLDALKDMLQNRKLGFKVIPEIVSSNGVAKMQWKFIIFSGKDHSLEAHKDPIIFSPEYANVSDVQYLESDAALKNICFVMGENEVLNTNSTARYKIKTVSHSGTFNTVEIVYDDGSGSGGQTYKYTFPITGDPDKDAKTEKLSTPFFNFTIQNAISSNTIVVVSARDLKRDSTDVPANTTLGTYAAASSWSPSYSYLSSQTRLSTRRCEFAGHKPDVSGLDRREMMLESEQETSYTDENGQEVSYGDEVYKSILRNDGLNELSNHKIEKSFSGSIVTEYENSQFRYRKDFDLGDKVTIKDAYGNEGNARITEMVYSNDGEGEKWYPTIQSEEEENEDEQ